MCYQKWLKLLAELEGQEAVKKFKRFWRPRLKRGFLNFASLEPMSRRLVLDEFIQRELLDTIFRAIDPYMVRTESWLFGNPADDGYLTFRHDSLTEIDLDSPEYDELFARADVFQHKPTVWAIHIERQRYLEGEYACYGVERIGSSNTYGYKIEVPYVILGDRGLQLCFRKVCGLIEEDHWLVQDPELAVPSGEDARFSLQTMSDAEFRESYEAVRSRPDIFRQTGLFKMIRNPTGKNVETQGPRGVGYANQWSWFAMPYDAAHPKKMGWTERFPVAWWWVDCFLEKRSRLKVAAEKSKYPSPMARTKAWTQ